MNELKTLYRHALHYLGGRVVLMMLGFISFPVFTRVFSVAEYGAMSLVLKVILLLTVVGKFGLQNSVQRLYAEDGASADKQVGRRYYSTLFFGAGSIGAVVTVAFLIAMFFLPASLMDANLRYLFLWAGVLILIRSVQPTAIGFLRAEGKTKTYNAVEIFVRAATVLVACSLLLLWKKSLTVFFGVTVAVEALGILSLMFYFYRRGLLEWRAVDWQYFSKAAWFAFPLIGYELATVILDSGDRLLVQHYLGAQPLGYYSAAYNVSTYVEESLMMPINLALFPIYMKLWVEKGKEQTQAFLSRSLNNFLALAVAVTCVVLLTSRDVIVVLASRKFQEAHRLLPVLVIGLLVYAIHIFLNAALLIHKKTGTMTALVVYACVVNVLLNIVLVPRIGLQGAAIATLISYLLLVLLMGRVSFRLMPLQLSYSGFAWNVVAASVTYFLLRSIELRSALLSAAVKSLSAMIVYSLLVCLLNPVVRRQVWNQIAKAKSAKAKESSPEAARSELAVN
ncbi:MAG TPA: oligosaccharide flippase family protein [Candidatus Angelobacter sp.]|nr:oligosaccharide flippase family protein [Candidatus Angelobacter sp.]